MSAPSIPNLLSLRGTRPSRAPRRRPAAARSNNDTTTTTTTTETLDANADITVQATDIDAAQSRLSAVHAGYLDDPYAALFVSRADGVPKSRLPIINRGTYTRTVAIDARIEEFLSPSSDDSHNDNPPQRQIVSLGAGTDTRPFRLFSRPQSTHITYHEIDFATTTRKKLSAVQALPTLSRVLTGATDVTPHTWTARPLHGNGVYYGHGLDLRRLSAEEEEGGGGGDADALSGVLRTDVPTLVLSECCLCYLEADAADRALRYFAARVVAGNISVVIYEPVPLDDAFGRVMVANLAARDICMPAMRRHRTPADQARRLRDLGFDAAAECHTVRQLWESWVSAAEKERVQQLQGLDEEEEWNLLAAHYVVAWGLQRRFNPARSKVTTTT